MSPRRLILGYAAVAALAALLLLPVDWRIALLVLASSHAPILYATLRPTNQWWGRVITRFRTQSNEVWLTIDDGPDSIDTPQLLDLLRQHGAKATFFVKGTNVVAAPQITRRIVEEGHELGNHSMTHPGGAFWCMPPGMLAREIDGCTRAIESSSGQRVRRFRPPVGFKNFFVHELLRQRDLLHVAWSARAFDGVGRVVPGEVAATVTKDLRPGTIILLHEGRSGEGDTRPNVEAMRLILEELQRRDFRAVIPADSQLLPLEDEQVVVEGRAEPQRPHLDQR